MEKISNLFIFFFFQGKPLTALCWGHNDRRLFVAAGFNLHVAWVMKKVPHLQFLCQRIIQICIKSEKLIRKLPLPARLHHSVQTMFSPTIKVNQSTESTDSSDFDNAYLLYLLYPVCLTNRLEMMFIDYR